MIDETKLVQEVAPGTATAIQVEVSPQQESDLVLAQAEILLAEYKCLRDELMFFIQAQRNSLNVLIVAVFGQTVPFFVVEQDAIFSVAFFLVSMFAIPLFIFIVMSQSLDATARVLVIADYIHKGLKPRMARFFASEREYFFWEEHKSTSTRVAPWLLHALDRSKWWVFILGICGSFVVSVWIGATIETGFSTISGSFLVERGWIPAQSPLSKVPDIAAIGFVLNAAYIAMVFNAGNAFQETTGEARFGNSRDVSGT